MLTRLILLLGATAVLDATAQAQAPRASPSPRGRGYVEGVAHSAFGNAPSQSYGAELGFRVTTRLQVFAAGGRTSNVAQPALGAHAQLIAGYLQRTQNTAVGFTAEQPITFGTAGLKFAVLNRGRFEPYIMGGAGAATVSSNVHFLLGASDITSTMASYGVTLGTDLSGSSTKPMLGAGGGVAWLLWKPFHLDFQYRVGRILDGDRSITTHLAGAGLAVWF